MGLRVACPFLSHTELGLVSFVEDEDVLGDRTRRPAEKSSRKSQGIVRGGKPQGSAGPVNVLGLASKPLVRAEDRLRYLQ